MLRRRFFPLFRSFLLLSLPLILCFSSAFALCLLSPFSFSLFTSSFRETFCNGAKCKQNYKIYYSFYLVYKEGSFAGKGHRRRQETTCFKVWICGRISGKSDMIPGKKPAVFPLFFVYLAGRFWYYLGKHLYLLFNFSVLFLKKDRLYTKYAYKIL